MSDIMLGPSVIVPLPQKAKCPIESFLAIIYGAENPENAQPSCEISINRNNKPHEADNPTNLLEFIKHKRRD
jgi:hypothetical protein